MAPSPIQIAKKANSNEQRLLAIVSTGLIAFVTVHFIGSGHVWEASSFLALHTILESFSLFVSFFIFFQGYLTFPRTYSRNRLIVSVTFLFVGIFDFLHLLSYKGMPFFQDEHTLTKATWLWLLARSTECIGLFYVFYLGKDKKTTAAFRMKIMSMGLLLSAGIIFALFNYPSQWPVLIKEGVGVTSFKKGYEYAISCVHALTLIFIIKPYREERSRNTLILMAGLFFILLSELVFTLYKNVYDIQNLLGHLYKVFGYFYLLRGIFYPEIDRIYNEKEEAEKKLLENEKNMATYILHAQEEERKRVSRELHDGIGQTLYAILVSLKMVNKGPLENDIKEYLQNTENLTSEAMTEIKRIATQLRPSALDDLGLLPAMRSFISQYSKTFRIHVELKAHVKSRYTPETETCLYRIFQEALTNAAKYSQTKHISVHLEEKDHVVLMAIQDFGVGFSPGTMAVSEKGFGIGLYSMRERVSLLSGTIEIISSPGNGTKIEVAVPSVKAAT